MSTTHERPAGPRSLTLPVLPAGSVPPGSAASHPDYRERAAAVDAEALAEELRGCLRGEVRFDRGSRALYATDASNYRMPPIGVVIPRDAGDVVAAVAAARKYGAPLLARGGGTSIGGQCCN